MNHYTNSMVASLLDGVRVGTPFGHANLTLVPLWGEGCRRYACGFMPATEAVQAGLVQVTELASGSQMYEVSAENIGSSPVLLPAGEELVGGNQDRMVTESTYLGPGTRQIVPTVCIEQGRWQTYSETFSIGSYAPPLLRRCAMDDYAHHFVPVADKASGADTQVVDADDADVDPCRYVVAAQCTNAYPAGPDRHDAQVSGRVRQQRVWSQVMEYQVRLGVVSPTARFGDIVDSVCPRVALYRDALLYPEGAIGVIAAVGTRFLALDMLTNVELFAAYWPRLITGYALDALYEDGVLAGGRFSVRMAKDVLDHYLRRVRTSIPGCTE